MPKVHDDRDGATLVPHGVAQLDRRHPPKRSGRAGAGGPEARSAGGQAPTLTHPTEPPSPAVLVLRDKTGRVSAGGGWLADALGLRFPAEAEVRGAAEALSVASRKSGLRSQIDVAPGVIRLRRTVPADDDDDSPGRETEGSSAIRSWTAKSRRQMMRSYAALDLAPLYETGRLPVMITLTYPGGDWLDYAPDGEVVQRHFAALQRAWLRAWDAPMVMLWKREFQHRGAPHFHIFAAQPGGVAGAGRRARYEAALLAWQASGKAGLRPRWRSARGDGLRLMEWVGEAWSGIVGSPCRTDVSHREAVRYVDPKRLAAYFTKHGLYRDKEYQNVPPSEWDGKPVGRFWGSAGLRPLVVSVQIDGARDYYVIKRTLRRWSARTRVWDADAKRYRYVKAVKVRTKGKRMVKRRGEPAEVPRTVTRPVSRLAGASGSLCLNDAPGMARQLARLVELTVSQDAASARPRPKVARVQHVGALSDASFLCEHCDRTHPLREHRVCRARSAAVVVLR